MEHSHGFINNHAGINLKTISAHRITIILSLLLLMMYVFYLLHVILYRTDAVKRSTRDNHQKYNNLISIVDLIHSTETRHLLSIVPLKKASLTFILKCRFISYDTSMFSHSYQIMRSSCTGI